MVWLSQLQKKKFWMLKSTTKLWPGTINSLFLQMENALRWRTSCQSETQQTKQDCLWSKCQDSTLSRSWVLMLVSSSRLNGPNLCDKCKYKDHLNQNRGLTTNQSKAQYSALLITGAWWTSLVRIPSACGRSTSLLNCQMIAKKEPTSFC